MKYAKTTEAQIVYEVGNFWVCRRPKHYTVYRSTLTHSIPDSSYHATNDGLSLAIARCDYLAKRQTR